MKSEQNLNFIQNNEYDEIIIIRITHMEKIPLDNTSYFGNGSPLIQRFLASVQNTEDRYSFQNSVQSIDQQLYDLYAPDNYRTSQVWRDLYQPTQSKTSRLEVPKQNSLTDSLLRTTMGCEENLAKSYIQIIDQTEQKDTNQKKKRIEEAKKKFADTNSHKDFCANSKPFMNTIRFSLQRPVIDSEHDSYLKTQLIFLEQPKATANTKQYFDKHTDNIAKKINQMGGMEDTIGRMEDSLSKNEVKSFKKKQVLASMNQDRKYLFSSPPKAINRADSGKLRDSWINRSREMRESFMTKFNID